MGVDENSEAGDKKADAMESKGMKSKVSEKECERNETLVSRSPHQLFIVLNTSLPTVPLSHIAQFTGSQYKGRA